MKLPVPALFNKKEKSEYFLSLLLRDEKASAVILEELNGKIHIIGKHEEYFSTSVEDVSIEEMLDVLDKTISKAEEKLPPNLETEKTVFGVKENWVEEKKIKREYLSKLKKVSDELHLQPIGFLVISEAIAHLIQEEEGAPFTGIISEVGRRNVTLTLFRAGKPLETHAERIEESVPKTVDAVLKQFTSADILPSRVIIFNGKNSEELSQEFITHQWSRSLPFLHVPQVAVLPHNFDARAVVFGAAEQMGFEIIGSIVDKTAQEIQPLPGHSGVAKKPEDIIETEAREAEALTEKNDKDEDKEKEDDFPTEGDNFGFVMEKDIAEAGTETEKEKPDTPEKREDRTSEHEPKFATHRAEHNTEQEKAAEDTDSEEPAHETRSTSSPLSGVLAGMQGVMSSVTGVFSKVPDIGFMIRSGNKLLLIPPLVLLLVIGAVLFYVFQSTATVNLSLQPKMVDEEESVVFAINGSNDFAENIIQAKRVTTTLSGNDTTTTTGKKEVGESAKGSITLFNSDQGKKTLPAGTVIKSSNDLEFTLDKEVAIASASGDIFTGIKSGTAKVEVTARKIGTESNLPSSTTFTVEGSSTVAAKNDAAFSGGTKKNVQVVSKKDQEKLASELPKSLETKANEELEKKLSADEVLVPGFTETTLSKPSYSQKVDAEAKELKLTADVTFEAIVYNKSDITEYAQTLLKDRATSDQAIEKDNIEAEVKDLKMDEDEATAKLLISAGLLPKLDAKRITTDITGKSFDEANQYLTDLPQVENAEIEISPDIPFIPKLLPRREANIKVVITN